MSYQTAFHCSCNIDNKDYSILFYSVMRDEPTDMSGGPAPSSNLKMSANIRQVRI